MEKKESQVLDIFPVDSFQANEMIYNVTNSSSSLSFTSPSEIPLPQTYNPSNTTYWRPSDELQKVLRLLHEENYAQFPCIPCSYCLRLLYPQSAKWVVRNNDITYPLQTYFHY